MITRLMMTATVVVLGLRAAPAGEPTPEALLPVHEERDAYEPCAAFGKDVYLVCWQSGRLAPGDLRKEMKFCADIVGCRVDKTGKALDTKPFVICGAPDLQARPRAAFGDGNFLVVWQDIRNGKDWDVYAARVTPDGKVLDPDGILVSGGEHNQAAPRVAWDGKTFVVVWEDFRSGKIYEVYGARVTPQGQVLDKDGLKLDSENAPRRHCITPEVASAGDGKSFVLLVHSGLMLSLDASGLFVSDGKGGELVYRSTRAQTDGPKGNGPSRLCKPVAMAAGGGVYLATWQTMGPQAGFHGGGSNAAIFGAGGQRKANVTLGGTWIVLPDAAWDGEAFVVTWYEFQEDQGSTNKGPAPNQWRSNRPTSDVVFAARVSAEGKVLGETWRLSGVRAAPASFPAVASDGAGTSLLVYEKHPATADVPIKIGYRILHAAP